MRVALGYDSHRLTGGGGLVLGGVFVPCDFAVEGAHSDGDVLFHALTDALLSPFGTDIGVLYPNTAPEWKGADSSFFVKDAAKMLLKVYDIMNIDILIIADAPKISPHAEAIRQKTASLLSIDVSLLSLRGKTTEGTQPHLMQAFCTALFSRK